MLLSFRSKSLEFVLVNYFFELRENFYSFFIVLEVADLVFL